MESHESPLSNHPVYKGDNLDDVRQTLSRLYDASTVEPIDRRGAALRTSVDAVRLPRISFYAVEFQDGFKATTPPLDFHTIQLGLRNKAHFSTRHHESTATTRTGVVLSAGDPVTVQCQEPNSTLGVVISDKVLQDFVTIWTGNTKSPGLRFQPRLDPRHPRHASLVSLINTFVSELNQPGGILETPAVAASMENALITALMFGLDHNLSDALGQHTADAGCDQVRQVEEYIEGHAAEPIDMATLASVTDHTASAIYRAFRRHPSHTPMQFLRDVRLRIVRQRLLLAQPPDSVTSIAINCGFTHLGRFSKDYKRRFGESPSKTLLHALKQ